MKWAIFKKKVCPNNEYLDEDYICLKHCPTSKYKDQATLKCLPCHNTCLECNGPNENDCSDCLLPTRILTLDPSSNTFPP